MPKLPLRYIERVEDLVNTSALLKNSASPVRETAQQ